MVSALIRSDETGSALGVAPIVPMLQSNMTEELEEARMLAANTLLASAVLDAALKGQLAEKLAVPAPAANMASPKLSAETALAGIGEQGAHAAAEPSAGAAGVVRGASGGQMQEVRRLRCGNPCLQPQLRHLLLAAPAGHSVFVDQRQAAYKEQIARAGAERSGSFGCRLPALLPGSLLRQLQPGERRERIRIRIVFRLVPIDDRALIARMLLNFIPLKLDMIDHMDVDQRRIVCVIERPVLRADERNLQRVKRRLQSDLLVAPPVHDLRHRLLQIVVVAQPVERDALHAAFLQELGFVVRSPGTERVILCIDPGDELIQHILQDGRSVDVFLADAREIDRILRQLGGERRLDEGLERVDDGRLAVLLRYFYRADLDNLREFPFFPLYGHFQVIDDG